MDYNDVRDLVQSNVLVNLFGQEVAGQIALKGGMAMRTCHGGQRYTQDIDVAADPNTASTGRVRNLVKSAFKELQKNDAIANAQLSEPKQTDTVQRWRFHGDIGRYSDIQLTVEVSRRDPLPEGHVETVRWSTPNQIGASQEVDLEVFDKHALADAKVSCLCGDREEPRDLLDLDKLISEGARPLDLLGKRGLDEVQRMRNDLWDRLEKIDWDMAKTTLQNILPADAFAELDENRWEEIRVNVGERVQNWLDTVQAELQETPEVSP